MKKVQLGIILLGGALFLIDINIEDTGCKELSRMSKFMVSTWPRKSRQKAQKRGKLT